MQSTSDSTNKKLKIGFLLDDTLDSTDGVQQYVLAVGEYLRKCGHEVHYLVAQTTRKDIPEVHQLSRFISLKFNGNSVRTPVPANRRELRKVIERLTLDVVHVQMPFSPLFAGRFLSLLPTSTRVVGTWHTYPSGKLQYLSHHILSFLISKPMKRVEVAIGVSQATADFADAVYHTSSLVIPNAVDLRRFKIHSMRTEDKFKTVITFLGRFDERKGPKYLLYALKRASELGFDFGKHKIQLGGKGPDLESCKELAKKLGIASHVVFLGFVDEQKKAELLASSDICIFPSTGGEAFGISLVEAMASGYSVVLAGDNAGYRSILRDFPELLFNPKDSEAFANTIISYTKMSKDDRNKISQRLKFSAEQYDTSVVCEKLLKLYYS